MKTTNRMFQLESLGRTHKFTRCILNNLTILMVIDLKNAFGSVSHFYPSDILRYISVLSAIQAYVQNLYSKLAGYEATKA